ncbi:type IV pilus modification protein PilV [Massilia sp. H-1]|nr:type IV pilus modification protein PilV [Massilia sp. H-1]
MKNKIIKQQGFTLVEILVTIVIFAFGMLGVAGLQLVSLTGMDTAQFRSVATLKASDMAERIRANSGATYVGVSALKSDCRASYYNSTVATPSGCIADTLAADEISDWETELSKRLPGGKGAICNDSTPNDGTPSRHCLRRQRPGGGQGLVDRQAAFESGGRSEARNREHGAVMKKQTGFSLMEMLVAMALGLLVVGGVAAVLASSSTIYKSSESRARIQEGSRFSLGMLQEDVRMSGHMGCFNYDLIPNRYSSIVKDGGFDGEYATRVVGYDALTTGGFHATLPTHIGQTGFKPVNGSDVLVVRVPTGKTLPVSDVMPTDEVPIPLGDATGLEADRMAVVSDCNYAVLFVMTNVPADKKIGHAANKNTQVSLGRTFRNDQGASLTPVSSVAYFVAAAANGVAKQQVAVSPGRQPECRGNHGWHRTDASRVHDFTGSGQCRPDPALRHGGRRRHRSGHRRARPAAAQVAAGQCHRGQAGSVFH